jgi:anti-sigma B factor antagonist
MKIQTRTFGDVHVLDISGKITLGEATKTIRHTISDLLQNGGRKIVLNLADVNYIDS